MTRLDDLLADLTSGDDVRAEKASAKLAALGEGAVPELLALTASEKPDDRWWAYCSLGQMIEAQPEWVIPGLSDPSAEVRESAAMALCHHPSPKAIPCLVDALSDDDRMLATLATNALIGIGKESTLPLVDVISKGSPAAQIEAARALSEIRDGRAIPAFMAAMENGSEMVRFWSERGLENLGVGMVYFDPG
jgi:HEAT repeat protein